jgi:solute carrier family 5 (sodium-coupled monocarboxylate transporter), member 8/12
VIWTDTFQVIVMFIAMLAVVLRGNFEVGGFARVWNVTQQSGREEFFK